jgi:hypothetical protein
MLQRILLIGATGLLGEAVAPGLVEGDDLNRADVEETLAGCDSVHIASTTIGSRVRYARD